MPSKLGGLPQVSGDEPTLQPAPVVNYDATVNAFSNLADQAKSLAQPFLEQQAAEAGDQSVARDAQGNVQAKTIPVIGPQSEAYMHAAQLRYMTESALDYRPRIEALKAKYDGDPNGFRAALDGLTAGAIQNAPSQFQPALRNMIEQDGTAALTELTAKKNEDDLKKAKGSALALIEQNKDTLSGYARSNSLSDPRAQALVKETTSLYESLENNPAFNLSHEQIQQEIASFQSNLKGEAVAGQADDLYKQYGEAEAERRLGALVNDPSLNLSAEERQHYHTLGLQEIRFQHAMTTQGQEEAQRQIEYQVKDAMAKAVATGDYSDIFTDDQVKAAYSGNPWRANQILEGLHGNQRFFYIRKQVAMASPAQLQQMEQKYNPANGGAATVPKMSVGEAIYGQESSFGANAGPSIDGSSIGPMQIRPDTFRQYAKPGESIDNPDDNRAVGQRIVADYEKRWPNDPARVAVAYFSGPGNVAPAGSPTPYLHDARDANGKSVSSYVADVTGRMGVQSGFAARERDCVAFKVAETERAKALGSDPANYVLGQRSDIVDQLNDPNPATAQNGVRALLTTQRDFGAPNPRILTNGQKANILGQFNTPPEGKSKAQNTLDVLNMLQGHYGQYYPQVMGELAKGLPADITGLDWVKGDKTVAARMATAVNTGRAELDKLLPSGSGLDRAILENMAPFNSTLRGLGGSAQAARMVQSVQLYARQLVAEGVDPGNAATQAANDVVNKRYYFADTYRVPTGVDYNKVADGTRVVQSRLQARNLEPYGLPAPGVTPEHRQQMSESVLRGNGVWTTLPDDSGLALTWGPQSGYLQARDAHGQPIRYTWAQLTALGTSYPYPHTVGTDAKMPVGITR